VCDDYINANYFKVAFKDCVLFGIHFVENMPEADMKNKVTLFCMSCVMGGAQVGF